MPDSRSTTPIMDAYEAWAPHYTNHNAGTFPTDVLRSIERLLPPSVSASAETGCGKSTILFSNISRHHTVFCLDDRDLGVDSSVLFFENCPVTKRDRIELILGPTQRTLPTFKHAHRYGVVMLDGPHGWPFPELEYYFFYPMIEPGGLLVLDDCNIPTLGRMADILAEDEMWHLEGFAATAIIFRRTDAPLFDPAGDGWWDQRYNRRRVSRKRNIFMPGEPPIDSISSLHLDRGVFDSKIEPDAGGESTDKA